METIVSIPTAKAGQPLATPALVTTSLISVSTREIKDKEGKVIGDVIVLVLAGLPTNVLRTPAQVRGDLSTYYTKETLQLISSNPLMCVHAYNEAFAKKEITFEGAYHEAGAFQTIDENSKLYINGIVNPETNKPFAVGDTVATTSAGIWVEGFLNAMVSVEESRAILADFLAAAKKAQAAEDAMAI